MVWYIRAKMADTMEVFPGIETVVDEYQLSVEQVRAALAYAAHVAAHVPPAVRQAS